MTVAAKAQSQLSLPSVTSVEIWPRAVPPVISVGVRTCLLGREVFGGGAQRTHEYAGDGQAKEDQKTVSPREVACQCTESTRQLEY